jgi:hypothetical protein
MGQDGSTTSGRTKLRQSRALDTRSLRLKLTHMPSGIMVKGEIPDGHYAKKEMNRLKEELRRVLFQKLESKVAREMRIAGR